MGSISATRFIVTPDVSIALRRQQQALRDRTMVSPSLSSEILAPPIGHLVFYGQVRPVYPYAINIRDNIPAQRSEYVHFGTDSKQMPAIKTVTRYQEMGYV